MRKLIATAFAVATFVVGCSSDETEAVDTSPSRRCSSSDRGAPGDDVVVQVGGAFTCSEAIEAIANHALDLIPEPGADPGERVEVAHQLSWARIHGLWQICQAMQTGVERNADFEWEPELANWLNDERICVGDADAVVWRGG